ncbi:hypothetical protein [Citreimonas salinaria]|uniref:Uncharacterized protein n=1 Tax=Citreimonas salinaria TaxID=321339 RepID=A0A1H3EYJ5_9RHOB|nr:hypothetical protein [Citreimonas salinaria]SDX83811.1 hypothetical protein SAMN05444340_10173 [Citreimonas salinaria]
MTTHLRTADVVARQDVLLSVCLADLPQTKAAHRAVREFARTLDARFRFREIILIADEDRREAFLPLVRDVPNVRLFLVRSGLEHYERRVIAAEEAIGDVILMANAAELASIDALRMIERAADEGLLIVGLRPEQASLGRIVSAPVAALGHAAGFKVGVRDMQTMAVPRTLLNQILSHAHPELALRFPPRDTRLPLGFETVREGMVPAHAPGQLRRRLMLIDKLLVHLAPRVLLLVTLSSGLLSLLGLAYIFYVLGVWVFVSDIEPGWLTISAMQGFIAGFMGLAVLGLSLGLQHLLALMRNDRLDSVTEEVAKVDLFQQVAHELNVDLNDEATTSGTAGNR